MSFVSAREWRSLGGRSLPPAKGCRRTYGDALVALRQILAIDLTSTTQTPLPVLSVLALLYDITYIVRSAPPILSGLA